MELRTGDALVITDVQRDFCPGGALAVPRGDEIIPELNKWISEAVRLNIPIFATRDWHPPNHCSFKAQGGPWPPHCIAGTPGANFADTLALPRDATIISKAQSRQADAYSGFQGTDLGDRLRRAGIARVFVGGLATDYCVLNTVKDARTQGFDVMLLVDAIRAVNVNPGDAEAAEAEMRQRGARPLRIEQVAP